MEVRRGFTFLKEVERGFNSRVGGVTNKEMQKFNHP